MTKQPAPITENRNSFIHSFIHFNSGSKAHKSTQTEDKKHNTQHKKTEKHKTGINHSITESTVRRLTIGERIEKRDATTAQLSPAHFVHAISKVCYTR